MCLKITHAKCSFPTEHTCWRFAVKNYLVSYYSVFCLGLYACHKVKVNYSELLLPCDVDCWQCNLMLWLTWHMHWMRRRHWYSGSGRQVAIASTTILSTWLCTSHSSTRYSDAMLLCCREMANCSSSVVFRSIHIRKLQCPIFHIPHLCQAVAVTINGHMVFIELFYVVTFDLELWPWEQFWYFWRRYFDPDQQRWIT